MFRFLLFARKGLDLGLERSSLPHHWHIQLTLIGAYGCHWFIFLRPEYLTQLDITKLLMRVAVIEIGIEYGAGKANAIGGDKIQ